MSCHHRPALRRPSLDDEHRFFQRGEAGEVALFGRGLGRPEGQSLRSLGQRAAGEAVTASRFGGFRWRVQHVLGRQRDLDPVLFDRMAPPKAHLAKTRAA